MGTVLSLVIGGAAGTISRWALTGAVTKVCGTAFPYGTMIVNLTGCLLVGILSVLPEPKFAFSAHHARVFLIVGFCGAFTTFSTFIFETSDLIQSGESLQAFINVIVGVTAGFLVFRLGMFLGEIF